MFYYQFRTSYEKIAAREGKRRSAELADVEANGENTSPTATAPGGDVPEVKQLISGTTSILKNLSSSTESNPETLSTFITDIAKRLALQYLAAVDFNEMESSDDEIIVEDDGLSENEEDAETEPYAGIDTQENLETNLALALRKEIRGNAEVQPGTNFVVATKGVFLSKELLVGRSQVPDLIDERCLLGSKTGERFESGLDLSMEERKARLLRVWAPPITEEYLNISEGYSVVQESEVVKRPDSLCEGLTDTSADVVLDSTDLLGKQEMPTKLEVNTPVKQPVVCTTPEHLVTNQHIQAEVLKMMLRSDFSHVAFSVLNKLEITADKDCSVETQFGHNGDNASDNISVSPDKRPKGNAKSIKKIRAKCAALKPKLTYDKLLATHSGIYAANIRPKSVTKPVYYVELPESWSGDASPVGDWGRIMLRNLLKADPFQCDSPEYFAQMVKEDALLEATAKDINQQLALFFDDDADAPSPVNFSQAIASPEFKDQENFETDMTRREPKLKGSSGGLREESNLILNRIIESIDSEIRERIRADVLAHEQKSYRATNVVADACVNASVVKDAFDTWGDVNETTEMSYELYTEAATRLLPAAKHALLFDTVNGPSIDDTVKFFMDNSVCSESTICTTTDNFRHEIFSVSLKPRSVVATPDREANKLSRRPVRKLAKRLAAVHVIELSMQAEKGRHVKSEPHKVYEESEKFNNFHSTNLQNVFERLYSSHRRQGESDGPDVDKGNSAPDGETCCVVGGRLWQKPLDIRRMFLMEDPQPSVSSYDTSLLAVDSSSCAIGDGFILASRRWETDVARSSCESTCCALRGTTDEPATDFAFVRDTNSSVTSTDTFVDVSAGGVDEGCHRDAGGIEMIGATSVHVPTKFGGPKMERQISVAAAAGKHQGEKLFDSCAINRSGKAKKGTSPFNRLCHNSVSSTTAEDQVRLAVNTSGAPVTSTNQRCRSISSAVRPIDTMTCQRSSHRGRIHRLDGAISPCGHVLPTETITADSIIPTLTPSAANPLPPGLAPAPVPAPTPVVADTFYTSFHVKKKANYVDKESMILDDPPVVGTSNALFTASQSSISTVIEPPLLCPSDQRANSAVSLATFVGGADYEGNLWIDPFVSVVDDPTQQSAGIDIQVVGTQFIRKQHEYVLRSPEPYQTFPNGNKDEVFVPSSQTDEVLVRSINEFASVTTLDDTYSPLDQFSSSSAACPRMNCNRTGSYVLKTDEQKILQRSHDSSLVSQRPYGSKPSTTFRSQHRNHRTSAATDNCSADLAGMRVETVDWSQLGVRGVTAALCGSSGGSCVIKGRVSVTANSIDVRVASRRVLKIDAVRLPSVLAPLPNEKKSLKSRGCVFECRASSIT
jgi:hypothetical protein